MKRFRYLVAAAVTALVPLLPAKVLAADASTGNFSLQVSPSPIVQTVKPGQKTTIAVKVRNTGTATEELKMGLRGFTVDSETGEVQLKEETPKEVDEWVTFEQSQFTVASGASTDQNVTFDVPADAGFSYSFALLVSRANPVKGSAGKTAIEGSVAIFTLLTVDRPGAVKKIEVVKISSNKKVYEFLPSEFSLQLKNSGNVIIAPAGNVFIQRGATSSSPLAVLPVNSTGAYILPGVSRTVTTKWTDGFPVYKTDAQGTSRLTWDWGTLQKLRIGKYTARVVVIYNDGSRDIPIEASVSFWVMPWRLLFGVLVVLILVVVGVVTSVRKTAKLAHTKGKKDGQADKAE